MPHLLSLALPIHLPPPLVSLSSTRGNSPSLLPKPCGGGEASRTGSPPTSVARTLRPPTIPTPAPPTSPRTPPRPPLVRALDPSPLAAARAARRGFLRDCSPAFLFFFVTFGSRDRAQLVMWALIPSFRSSLRSIRLASLIIYAVFGRLCRCCRMAQSNWEADKM
jgi:hypothetical protein